MKSLLASLLLLVISGFCTNLNAQSNDRSSASLSPSDRAILQSWAEASQPNEARIENDRLILPGDDRDAVCAYMRVYRVKRDVPGSDLTRPAGYTTCVGAARFSMKSSAVPKSKAPLEPVQGK